MESLTASRALVSDGSGDLVVSNVTSAEIDHLDGILFTDKVYNKAIDDMIKDKNR